jgi:hypothetical protein
MITTNSDRIMTRLEVGERVLLCPLNFISAMATVITERKPRPYPQYCNAISTLHY